MLSYKMGFSSCGIVPGFGKSSHISLSMIVLNNRDWSEIVWLLEILCLKINLTIGFIQKIHWNALVML